MDRSKLREPNLVGIAWIGEEVPNFARIPPTLFEPRQSLPKSPTSNRFRNRHGPKVDTSGQTCRKSTEPT